MTSKPSSRSLAGNIGGVVDRIGERAGFLIGAVADDQRDAPLRPGIGAQQQKPEKRQREKDNPAHRAL